MDTYGNTKTKDISQYLHLYLGADVKFEKCNYHFVHNIGVNAGDIRILTARLLTAISGSENRNFVIKLLLRPLSSMTDEEKANEISLTEFRGGDDNNERMCAARGVTYLLSKKFDLFGLIEAGIALDATNLKIK